MLAPKADRKGEGPTDTRHGNGGGIDFRAVEGKRSSQDAGRTVFSEAAASVDASLAGSIARQKEWRKSYLGPVRQIVEAGAGSGKDALRIATEGLAAVHQNLVYRRGDSDLPLLDALDEPAAPPFETGTISGRDVRLEEVVVPYRGSALRGDDLRRQLDRWVEAGVIEPSCARAVATVVENPGWLELSDVSFVLLGAAAEMGPLEWLCRWGADVVAVDLQRPEVWDRIANVATEGSGRVRFPQSDGRRGADLLAETPEVAAWLRSIEGPVVVGSYAYADGSSFLKLAAALDALTVNLQRDRSDTAIAYLATPTDVFAVPVEVVERSRARRMAPPSRLARGLTRGRLFGANYPSVVDGENGRRWGIADSLVPQQGPNYALAKMLQRWRAIVAREEGTLTSANVAPATRTRSVVKNKILAAAYRGAPAFGIEIFEPETSRALMAALLVHDLRNPAAVARADAPLDHPFDLFTDAAAHGGLWSVPYAPRSVLPLAVAIGAAKRGPPPGDR